MRGWSGWCWGMALLAGLILTGCGTELDLPGLWDNSCYDCRTVCEGTQDDTRDDCLQECDACQGHSECFHELADQYQGMRLDLADWRPINCEQLR
jgi:hypothetical protein